MEHNGEARQAAADLFQDVKPQLGLLAGFKFVSAVAGADGDGQRIHAGAGDKLFYFSRVGVRGVFRFDIDRILDAS